MLKRTDRPIPHLILGCILALPLLLAGQAQAGVKVGLIAASSNAAFESDVKASLDGLKIFDTVDTIDGSGSTPDVTKLQSYDAVLVYSDGNRFANGNTLGDNLATYIDKGGGVVLMDPFATAPFGSGLGGRFQTDYELIDSGNANSTFGLNLGMKAAPMHPVLNGVNAIMASGNDCFTRPGYSGAAVRNGGTVIASWSDSNGLAVVGTIKGHTRVDLNIWAASTAIGFAGCWAPGGDVPKLMGNALIYVANPLRANPGTVEFGDVGVGLSNGPQTVQVTNTGAAAVTLTDGIVAPTGEFVVTLDGGATFPLTVAAGASFSFDVTFTPSTAGSRTASYTLTPMGTTPPLSITLHGNGIGPRFGISPAMYDFGGSKFGGPPRTVDMTITNTGGGQLRLQSITLSDSMNFTLDNVGLLPHVLSGGASLTFTVKFTPTDRKLFTGTVNVMYDLVGVMNGVVNMVNVRGSSGDPKISVDAGGISLPPVRVGKDGPPGYVTVTNNGFADLTLSTLMFTGTNPMDFVVDTKAPQVVPPNGGTLNLMVHVHPTAQGMRKADLHIMNDDTMNPDVVVPFDSVGTVANFDIMPMMLDFTNGGMVVQQTGTCSAAQTVTVSNSGTDTLTINSVSVTGTNAASFTQPIMGSRTVPGHGGTVAIPVQFCPQSIGTQTASLVVATDLMPGHMATVPLSGKATGPHISAAPGMLDFGPVYIRTTSKAQTLTLTNDGDQDIVFGKGAVNPPTSPFVVTGLPAQGAKLAAKGTLMLSVTAMPMMAVQADASLDIPVNDMVQPGGVLKIPLHVLGIQANIAVQPPTISFPPTAVGLKSAPMTVSVVNTGMADLTQIVFSVAGPGNAPTDFVLDGMTPTTLKPGATANVQVHFAPMVTGARNATLRIDAAGLAVTQQVKLDGMGTMLMVACTPDTKDFGMVQVGQMTMGTFLCTNNDTKSIDISYGFDDQATEWMATSDSMTIPGGQGTLQLTVVFKPTSTGDKSTNLTIKSKDGGAPIMMLGVNGMGVAPVTTPPPAGGCSCSTIGARAQAGGFLPLGLLCLLSLGLLLRRRARSARN